DERSVYHDQIHRLRKRLGRQVPRVGTFHRNDTRIAPQPLMQLSVADIDRVDALRAALKQAVREATGRRSEIGGNPPCRIELERVQRTRELHASPRYERMIGPAHFEWCIGPELLARFVDAPVTGEDLSRENEGLRASTGLHQSSLDEQNIRSLSTLTGHPDSGAQNGMSSSPKSSGGKSSAWWPPPPPP